MKRCFFKLCEVLIEGETENLIEIIDEFSLKQISSRILFCSKSRLILIRSDDCWVYLTMVPAMIHCTLCAVILGTGYIILYMFSRFVPALEQHNTTMHMCSFLVLYFWREGERAGCALFWKISRWFLKIKMSS